MKINCSKIFFRLENEMSQDVGLRYYQAILKSVSEIIPEDSDPKEWINIAKSDNQFVSSILETKDSNAIL